MYTKPFNSRDITRIKSTQGKEYFVSRVSKEKDGTITVILKERRSNE